MIKKLVVSTSLAMLLAGTAAADVVLRYAEASPNRGARAEALQFFAKDAERLSNGEVKLDIHWGGALFDFTTSLDGVMNGSADMGTILGIYNPQKLRVLTIGDIPQKFSDPWVGMRAMYELMTTNESVQESLARRNLVYLTGYSSTGVQFECGEGAVIHTVDDIKGKRIRAAGNYGKVLNDLGANLVSLSASDTYQALDTGLVDCSASYLYAMRTLKTHEVADNVTLAHWGQVSGFASLLNRDTWQEMSDEQRKALREAGSNTIDFYGERLIDEMTEIVEGLRTGSIGRKVAVYEMAEEERAKLLAASQKYAHEWVEKVTEGGLDGEEIWKDYQALLTKYEDERDSKGYPWQR
tara:strand:+ start:20800 stop:21858 length:1059 start_codon:yes stop_codon:yes gene_type:complete